METDKEEVDAPKEEEEISTPEEEVDEQQSEETEIPKEEVKEDPAQMVKNLQKGYTMTRQELSEIKKSLEDLKQAPQGVEPASEPQTWEELKTDLLSELDRRDVAKAQQEIAQRQDLDNKLQSEIDDLRFSGKISTQAEEEELLKYATDLIESKKLSYIPTLHDAHNLLQEKKEAIKQGREEGVKTDVKEEEASKIGKSSKAIGEERTTPSYDEIHNTDLFEL